MIKFTKKVERRAKKQAFSLIELSLVMLIGALILGGSFSAIKTGLKTAKAKTTKSNLEYAYQAIGEFIAKEKRLPCPAKLNTSIDSSDDFGIEARSGNSCSGLYTSGTVVYGGIPTRTLGISDKYASDGYGNKIAYAVVENLTRDYISQASLPGNLASSQSFGTLPDSQISISLIDIFPNSVSQIIFENAALVILSHGENMYGAFPLNQTTQFTDSPSASEVRNSAANTNFNQFIASDRVSNSVFDDILIFRSRDQIVMEFDLQNLIACDGSKMTSAAQAVFGIKSIYYGQELPDGTFTCSSPYENIRPKIKCLEYGRWGSASLCPQANFECVIPSSSDEVLKNNVLNATEPNLPGYSSTRNGATANIWSIFTPGTKMTNGQNLTNNFGTSPNFGQLSIRCVSGKIFATWTWF